MGLFGRIKIAVRNAQFRRWQRQNPGASFKDYFASIVTDDIRARRKHPTLGEHLCNGSFDESGKPMFERLVRYGLSPDDVCVDYGCGTLRVGRHVISYLGPGCYWGLDIDRTLLDEGARLVGPALMAEKQPRLRVISPDAVREAAEARPNFVFSVAVLIHVHPDELDEYFGNVLTLIGKSGTAIIRSLWTDGSTFQYGRQSWAHSFQRIAETADRLGGEVSVIEAREGTVAGTKAGILRLRQNDA